MRRIAMILAVLGSSAIAALTGGCQSPPTQEEMAAYDYGPRPENYEKIIRDYLWNNDKNMRGDYDGAYPMVFFIRDGKIAAANGGTDDNIIGWRYARTGCNELGAPFVTQ